VEALTSEVLFHLWEQTEVQQSKSGRLGGCGKTSHPHGLKKFTVAAAL